MRNDLKNIRDLKKVEAPSRINYFCLNKILDQSEELYKFS